MRILHLANGRLFGGIERMLVTIASASGASGLESSFAVACDSRLAGSLRSAGAAVATLGDVRLRRPGAILGARKRLRALLAAERVDVVACHAPWSHAIFAPVVRQDRRPLVLWLHDAPSARSLVDRWARCTRADLIIANSGWTARSAVGFQPGAPMAVVPCPVVVPGAGRSRQAIRAELGTDASDVVVLMASRLEAWKGHATLLHALASLGPSARPWTTWIAGGPQRDPERHYLNQLRTLARNRGIGERVRFLGEREDVADLMRAADVFCQPNDAPEPFGVALVEALAVGLPVIATGEGGPAEVLDHRCARLVPPRHPERVTAALLELMSDVRLRERMGVEGRAIAARYQPGLVLDQLSSVLGRLEGCTAAA